MADFDTALPLVFAMARKVQETGRAKDMSRTFSGTEGEISSYHANLLTASEGLSDAVCAIGDLLANQHEENCEPKQAKRLGWLLMTIGEMSTVINNELFALSERSN